MDKKVLVTGGAGFLGSHLCEALLKCGYKVICLDNFITGSEYNIKHLTGHPNFTTIAHDIVDPLQLEVNQIYNLACPASPVHYQADPIKTLKTNVLGIMNMLELCRKNHATILQASTSEVYGNPTVNPQVETYLGNVNCIGIRSCYDEGKRAAETLLFDYYRQYNIQIKVMRIFNTYGPKMNVNDGRVVSNFIVQALKGNDITIYGDGLQTRSFCYVDDLIKGMMALMNSPSHITGPINIGNPSEFTVKELANIILTMTGSKSKIVYKPLPADDPIQRKPDITKAKSELGWQPDVDLKIGIEKTIEYFRHIV